MNTNTLLKITTTGYLRGFNIPSETGLVRKWYGEDEEGDFCRLERIDVGGVTDDTPSIACYLSLFDIRDLNVFIDYLKLFPHVESVQIVEHATQLISSVKFDNDVEVRVYARGSSREGVSYFFMVIDEEGLVDDSSEHGSYGFFNTEMKAFKAALDLHNIQLWVVGVSEDGN